jgi:hypothetical protein
VADDFAVAAGVEALDCCGLRAGAADDDDAFAESEHVNANDATASNARMGSFFIVLRFASQVRLGSPSLTESSAPGRPHYYQDFAARLKPEHRARRLSGNPLCALHWMLKTNCRLCVLFFTAAWALHARTVT